MIRIGEGREDGADVLMGRPNSEQAFPTSQRVQDADNQRANPAGNDGLQHECVGIVSARVPNRHDEHRVDSQLRGFDRRLADLIGDRATRGVQGQHPDFGGTSGDLLENWTQADGLKDGERCKSSKDPRRSVDNELPTPEMVMHEREHEGAERKAKPNRLSFPKAPPYRDRREHEKATSKPLAAPMQRSATISS
ncbi:MAG: hypothetical protein HC923_01445 [Myxococcales bacterium]|nr:hypothetical protein [Myxococcales bacterium]